MCSALNRFYISFASSKLELGGTFARDTRHVLRILNYNRFYISFESSKLEFGGTFTSPLLQSLQAHIYEKAFLLVVRNDCLR
jgi:hypothetical protein